MYSSNQQAIESLYSYQQAMMALITNFNDLDIYSNPSLSGISSKNLLLSVLEGKGAILEKKWVKENGKKQRKKRK
ncbi:MAG: hypothetical protein COA57_15685 [Flavobacteriales bacterium]|nr:MAG: hypothetical protein COA57_15685 [Flavobacteriales bacterium]